VDQSVNPLEVLRRAGNRYIIFSMRTEISNKFIIAFFFTSGVAGLIYEIVWIRMLVKIFGNTTHSVTATVAAFLLGLAIGSLLGGRITRSAGSKNLLRYYGIVELGVAITALLSLVLLRFVMPLFSFFSDGTVTSASLLVTKFGLTMAILLLPTILMGMTLPLLVQFLQHRTADLEKHTSYLYAVNTAGAVLGSLLAGFFLLELFGLVATLVLAALMNIIIGTLAIRFSKPQAPQPSSVAPTLKLTPYSKKDITVLVFFAISGCISIAYQILWTRVLTPTGGTYIYAFTMILILYLLGIAIGSFAYKLIIPYVQRRNLLFCASQVGIGCFAIISVFIISSQVQVSSMLLMMGVILPATICMGSTLPAVVAILKKHRDSGETVGAAYFSNTLGNIVGAFVASFVLIPLVGSTQSILLLGVVNLCLALVLCFLEIASLPSSKKVIVVTGIAVLITLGAAAFYFKGGSLYERSIQQKIVTANAKGLHYRVLEDDIATVYAEGDSKSSNYRLFIDGVQTTAVSAETKFMAHLPVALHPDPHGMLVIAFGMGNTFRSALLEGMETDVVELSPSVPKMFAIFDPDSKTTLENSRGRIIINDGRNYVKLTKKRYDIVTIDPPPPFNSAGTTVLYSTGFYEDLSKILKPGGIVSQWVYFSTESVAREDDIAMAVKSYTTVFPFVRAYILPNGVSGVYLLGSHSPIHVDEQRVERIFTSPAVVSDFANTQRITAADVANAYIGDRSDLEKYVHTFPEITDNHPRTEYFLLRNLFSNYPVMTPKLFRQRILEARSE
jgi:spermidine synthase